MSSISLNQDVVGLSSISSVCLNVNVVVVDVIGKCTYCNVSEMKPTQVVLVDRSQRCVCTCIDISVLTWLEDWML